MITIRLAQDAQGMDHASATADGKTFRASSRHGATCKLARMVVAAGVEDQPWEAYGQTGGLRMRGPSIHNWAKWTYVDDARGTRRVPYRPFPVRGDAPGGLNPPEGI